MKNRRQTSQRIAELAGKTLGDPRASKKSKTLTPSLKLRRAGAASALAQAAVVKAAARKRHAASAKQRNA